MTDVFSKQIAIETENGIKLAKVPLGKIGRLEASTVSNDVRFTTRSYSAADRNVR
jgi:hypothetical protein